MYPSTQTLLAKEQKRTRTVHTESKYRRTAYEGTASENVAILVFFVFMFAIGAALCYL